MDGISAVTARIGEIRALLDTSSGEIEDVGAFIEQGGSDNFQGASRRSSATASSTSPCPIATTASTS